MLEKIRIQNFILIDSLELPINKGMTVMTGETGAGKSILLGALGAALGNRMSSTKVLKDTSKKAVIELECRISEDLKDEFESRDLDFEALTVFRRELLPNGKSRSFINDTPAKLSDLNAIAGLFIDINSQSDSGVLVDSERQISLIDSFGVKPESVTGYLNLYSKWVSCKYEIKSLTEEKSDEDLDYLKFLLNELERADVFSGEEEQLESTLKSSKLDHMRLAEFEQLNGLMQNENGILDLLFSLENSVQKLSDDSDFSDLLETVSSTITSLQAGAKLIQRKLDNASMDIDVSELEARLTRINELLRKHRVVNSDALVEKQLKLKAQIERIEHKTEKLDQLNKEQSQLESDLHKVSEIIHKERVKCTKVIEGKLQNALIQLDLPHARLSLEWQKLDVPRFYGMYKPVFMFTANPGKASEPLHKVASGGEQSRVKLALKAVLGEHSKLSCQIFDEIDTGISGSTAEKVGQLMNELARNQQIITITHLPQVAAIGTYHWKVEKNQDSQETSTHVQILDNPQRIEELARMLSGATVSEAAKKQAQALLRIH